MKTVILTTFSESTKAHMLHDLLMYEGIDSIIQGELINEVMGALQGFGVQVLVFEKDLERAQEILEKTFPEQ